jgi:DNA repair photolyase
MSNKRSSRREVAGTREWATETVNFCSGCSNACIYCYARHRAVTRFHRMSHEDWSNEVVRDHDVRRKRRHIDGRVMIPSTHDLTPGNIDAAEIVLVKLLEAGNEITIVSKPRLECIERLCDVLQMYKDKVLFRFSIGGKSERLRRFWEPEAPAFKERIACLRLACEAGFETSVSGEPLLEPWRAKEIVAGVRPFVSHSIWIGKLNQMRARTRWLYPDGHPEIDRLERWQSDEKVIEVYEALKDDGLIRFKESYKAVLGLDRPTAAGLDI